VSFGLEAFDATSNSAGLPDSQFIAWLGQGQWVRRLPWLDMEVLARTDLQLSNSALLPLEQFAVGGRYSVRGYRENTLVRDNGFIGSIETRIPLYQRVEPEIRWDMVPFLDVGHSWNTKRGEIGKQTLLSVGLGTRLRLRHLLRAELFWGHRLEDVERVGERDLQDSGVHFQISVDWP